MSKFQIILLVVFGFFILLAVLVFSVYRGGSARQSNVLIWGSIPAGDMNLLLSDASFASDRDLSISYVEKPLATLESDFTEALARGEGPDLIILPEDRLWKARTKLIPIPYDSISERDFKDTFAEGGEVFLGAEGSYALPLVIDPLVLYYNRDLLSAAAIAKPLAYWDEIYGAASKLTKRDAAGNLTQSAIALGETRNIGNAKDILSLLLLQAGTPITSLQQGSLVSRLNENPGLPIAPAESALDFYTQFANPSKPFYSWNRTLPDAQTHFAAGEAAYYLGFASEFPIIRSKSPTLNMALVAVPQSRVGGRTLTFGHVYGIALSRGSRNPQAAVEAAFRLVAPESIGMLSRTLGLPPARRDLLSTRPTEASASVFYDAALQSRTWLDPDPVVTRSVFSEAVEAVTSGRLRTTEALNAAERRLEDSIN